MFAKRIAVSQFVRYVFAISSFKHFTQQHIQVAYSPFRYTYWFIDVGNRTI